MASPTIPGPLVKKANLASATADLLLLTDAISASARTQIPVVKEAGLVAATTDLRIVTETVLALAIIKSPVMAEESLLKARKNKNVAKDVMSKSTRKNKPQLSVVPGTTLGYTEIR